MNRKNNPLLLVLGTGLLLLAACGTMKNKPGKSIRVDGVMTVEQPDCTGDDPGNPANRTQAALGNTLYYIKAGEKNDPNVIAERQLQTDENGHFSIEVPPGTYAIIHPDKLMTFGEFKLKHQSRTTYFADRDDDCFRRWYNAPDFLLKVSADTTINFMVKSKCYTKMNPCIEYTGPK